MLHNPKGLYYDLLLGPEPRNRTSIHHGHLKYHWIIRTTQPNGRATCIVAWTRGRACPCPGQNEQVFRSLVNGWGSAHPSEIVFLYWFWRDQMQ